MKHFPGSDGFILDWDASFFNEDDVRRFPAQKQATGISSGGERDAANARAARAAAVRVNLVAMARRAPEVMVKISGAGKNIRQIRAHLQYITREGKLEAENEEGKIIQGEDAVGSMRDDWLHSGYPVPHTGQMREALNIVLSMPAGTDPIAVKRAARDFAQREFAGRQYIMVLHTFDTDPDPEPSPHPHVHLCVKVRADNGNRLNPRKADLQRWREGFAEALREHGVDAAATRREHRLKFQRAKPQWVRYAKSENREVHTFGKLKASNERTQRAKQFENEILRRYRDLAQGLAHSDDPNDRALALAIVKRLYEDREAAKPKRQYEHGKGHDR